MRTIVITDADHRRLTDMIREHRTERLEDRRYLDDLARELNRAHVVSEPEICADVVTMNSTVRVRTWPGKGVMTFTLVSPEEADFDEGKVSILAPLGTAVLGYRIGDQIDWETPSGLRKIEIEAILFQPQASAMAQT